MDFFNSIVGMGAAVLMPIIFFIVGLIFRLRIGQAFKAALLVGVGFTGLNAVIDLLLNSLGPATNQMVERFNINLTTLDVGFAKASTIGWNSSLMPIGVIAFLVINLILFICKFTKTIDVDIFNYWIFLVCGAVVFAETKNFWLSLVIMALLFIVLLKIADWTAPTIQKEFGLQGVSFPHMDGAPWVIFGIATNWLINHIPGLNKIELSAETVNKKFGVLGDSMVVGFFLGLFIGILAGQPISKIMSLSITVAAAMVLLPKMVDILVDGLNIIRDAVETKMKKRYPDREVYIGMDVALMAGDPAVIATGILLIPITLLLAVILPGNKVLPLVDLPALIFLMPMMGAFCKKDIFKMLVSGTLMMVCILYLGTAIAPAFTEAAQMSGVALPADVSSMISLKSGVVNPLGFIAAKIGELLEMIF